MTLFAVNVAKFVPPLATVIGVAIFTEVRFAALFVIVTLAIVPPVTTTLARLFVPLPMPLMPFTTVEKLLSNCDNGMAVVTPAKVFGMLMGRAIRTSL